MTIPNGNGEARGPESADPAGTPLPGSRPSRAAANDARHKNYLYPAVADQGGFGTEDMHVTATHLSTGNARPSDGRNTPPDLAAMGDAGEPFGGM